MTDTLSQPTARQDAQVRLGLRPPVTDSMTVLSSVNGTASKRITCDSSGAIKIDGFNAGLLYRFASYPVNNIESLSTTLKVAEGFPKALVIRGEPLPGLDPKGTHRRKKVNFQTPAEGRRWVMIDFDKIALPAGMGLNVDVRAVREHIVGLLPPEFREASYYWQLSSSAGFGAPGTASLHAWFWLAYPVSDTDLKRWAAEVNTKAGVKLIDPALFNDVQPHYTAAPVFDGVVDPFPTRSGLERKAQDEVAINLPPLKARSAPRRSGGGVEASVGFENWLAAIGDHEGGQGFHRPIISAAASYVATHGAEGTDVEALYERIRDAVLAADRSGHDDAYVDQMASHEHIVPAIEQAITKFGDRSSPRRKAKRYEDVPPYYPTKSVTARAASDALKTEIDAFFEGCR